MSEIMNAPAGWEHAVSYYQDGQPVFRSGQFRRKTDGAVVNRVGNHWVGTAPGTKYEAVGKTPVEAMLNLDQMAPTRAQLRRRSREQVYDDIAVNGAAADMKKKLAQKREEGRGGWHKQFDPSTRTGCYAETLAWSLIDHMEKGDPVDVLNFAMFLHHRDDGAAAMREVGAKVREYAEATATLLPRLQVIASSTGMTVEQLVRDVEQRAGSASGNADNAAPTIDPLIYEAALELSYRVGLIGHKEYLDAKIEAMRARRDNEGGA